MSCRQTALAEVVPEGAGPVVAPTLVVVLSDVGELGADVDVDPMFVVVLVAGSPR